MNYCRVPTEISIADIHAKQESLSPGMYRRVIIPTSVIKPLRDLLESQRPFDKGTDPGSVWYMKSSPRYFIRTKALQEYSCLITPKGDAIIPINPRVFSNPDLSDGDILMSKDSNIGECAIIDGNSWKGHMFSGGIVRLHPACDLYYLFSFLKHPLFKEQLHAMTARGATITHAKTLWLDCLIPFPNQKDADRVIRYVSVLMLAIIEKERTLRDRNRLIDATIQSELESNQRARRFSYEYPTISDLRKLSRLDVGMYSEQFKRKMFLILNYVGGTATYEELGFEIGRGQNLQLSCIGKSIYSEEEKPNFYRLVAPTDISEYRTVRQFRFLGNKRSLALLKQGDVVFGAEGFCKGRVVILADTVYKTISNIHGITFHHKDGDFSKGIFLGCFLGYLRDNGLVDAIGAGGSGGSLAIGYFHHVPFPKFPSDKQAAIAKLYHNPAPLPADMATLENFLDWHRRWNAELGIWDLDREMKNLQRTLAAVQEKIINGNKVTVPIP